MKRYVLTGAPGSGKTSVLRALAATGYPVVDEAATDVMAARLAASPGIALAKIKAGLRNGEQGDLAAALDFEAVNQAACFRSEDFREGVAAFREKRKANFKGK